MKVKMIAIRDKVSDAYMQPSPCHNLGGAIREFGDLLKDPNNPLSKHPSHYDLYQVGEWDDNTGELTSIYPTRQLAIGEEMAVKA